MSRKIAREILMQYVYQMEMNDSYTIDDLDNILNSDMTVDIDVQDAKFIRSSIKLLIKNLASIDRIIEENLEGWSMKRIPRIDLAILRLAINEINNRDDIPDSVAINEAVNMAKNYSTDDSYKFVNGLLGSYYRSLGGHDDDSHQG